MPFCAAALVGRVLLHVALQSLQVELLLPAQGLRDHCALALYDTLASSPRAVSPEQSAGAAQWLRER